MVVLGALLTVVVIRAKLCVVISQDIYLFFEMRFLIEEVVKKLGNSNLERKFLVAAV
jgi:hypothetical protein